MTYFPEGLQSLWEPTMFDAKTVRAASGWTGRSNLTTVGLMAGPAGPVGPTIFFFLIRLNQQQQDQQQGPFLVQLNRLVLLVQ